MSLRQNFKILINKLILLDIVKDTEDQQIQYSEFRIH